MLDEGDDTLTESCEGAVNFMVVEMRDRSLHQVHLWDCCESRLRAMQAEGWYHKPFSLLLQEKKITRL